MLCSVNRGSPSAQNAAWGACNRLECALDSYSSGGLAEVQEFGDLADAVPGEPDVWIDDSLVRDEVSGACSSGAGFFAHLPGCLWADRRWGHLDDGGDCGGAPESCRGYCSVPGPLQSAQRAEFWCVILALQSKGGVHLGVDNLRVVRHVGRLLDADYGATHLIF